MSKDRLEVLVNALTRAARGDFSAQIELSSASDEIDAVGLGLSMMLEDLAALTEEQARSVEQVRSSEARIRTFTDAVRDAIIFMDPAGAISFWNPAAEEMFGWSREEALGKPLHALLAPERFSESFSKAFPQFKASGEGAAIDATLELVGRRKDGEEFPIELSLSSVAQGEAWGAIGVVRDITERKDAERRREDLQAELLQQRRLSSLGILARGAAHEINNPVAIVFNFAELIGDEVEPDSDVAEYANEICNAAQRVATITKHLMQFSRQRSEHRERVQPAALAASAASTIGPACEEDGVRIRIDVPDDLPEIMGSTGSLEQALVSTMDNAREALIERYPEPHGDKVIEVQGREVEQDGGRRVRITVSDSGSGIPVSVLGQIFDPFFTTKPRHSSAGLGLSICHGIIDDHGGALQAESEEGAWTRMHIDLPVATTPVEE